MLRPVADVGGIDGMGDVLDMKPLLTWEPPTCLRQRALRLLNQTFYN